MKSFVPLLLIVIVLLFACQSEENQKASSPAPSEVSKEIKDSVPEELIPELTLEEQFYKEFVNIHINEAGDIILVPQSGTQRIFDPEQKTDVDALRKYSEFVEYRKSIPADFSHPVSAHSLKKGWTVL